MTFNRGNAPVLTGHIWVGADADPTALIKDGGDVFSVATDQKFATIDDKGDLYSLDGQFAVAVEQRRDLQPFGEHHLADRLAGQLPEPLAGRSIKRLRLRDGVSVADHRPRPSPSLSPAGRPVLQGFQSIVCQLAQTFTSEVARSTRVC
jgi:hypothetical protein